VKYATLEDYTNFLSDNDILYSSPLFSTNDGEEIGVSHLFYVQLRSSIDITLLEKLSKKYNVKILGHNSYMPLWYTLACSKNTKGNTLEIVNIFRDSNQFQSVSPDVMVKDISLCTDDTFFNYQWNLKNTGQNDGIMEIDIHFCKANEITKGNQNVIIAVTDNGVELNHPDLTNIADFSYNAWTKTEQTVIGSPHGTSCAGIIGANSNNGLGISGIASNSPIMSLHYAIGGGYTLQEKQRVADVINMAWQEGASVISNSWGHNSFADELIDSAIHNALTKGRNGLGTIIAFATGNSNKEVIYPANSNDDIIAVGAVDRCGIRSGSIENIPNSCDPWSGGVNAKGSCFGTELDVVAPGTSVPTIDRQGDNGYNKEPGISGNYILNFGGTSAACPHVAAVAGLVLSVNPNLTQKEVSDIIEKTAQKVGGYNYQTVSGRNNGAWNEEMGYGLVDAYAAVVAAQNSLPPAPPVPPDCPENITLPNTTISSGATETHQASNTIENSTTYIIEDGGTVILKGNEIILNPGFEAEEGSTFEATVDPCE